MSRSSSLKSSLSVVFSRDDITSPAHCRERTYFSLRQLGNSNSSLGVTFQAFDSSVYMWTCYDYGITCLLAMLENKMGGYYQNIREYRLIMQAYGSFRNRIPKPPQHASSHSAGDSIHSSRRKVYTNPAPNIIQFVSSRITRCLQEKRIQSVQTTSRRID